MIKLALTFLIAGLCTVFAVQPIYAATAAAPKETAKVAESPVPMSTVLQNLRMNGYTIVSKVELVNGVFAIDAITPQGKAVSVLMKAHTGEITKPKVNPAPRVSLEDAVKRVEGSGYHDIYKVEYNGSKYVVRAYDQKGKKTKLKVDGSTGEISTSWF